MLRKILVCCSVILIVMGGGWLSYSVSKKHAGDFARSYYKGELSPLHGQIILFIDGDLKPCWLFRWEYDDAWTGATFDVYISLFGTVLNAESPEE
ncbi:MAG: hypothetical protein GY801_02685 [bacterium]|nr:hypothetical protein [bacterium]